MHSAAKCLFNSSSWISARFCFQEEIRGLGCKSNLPNMAILLLVNVDVHNRDESFKLITLSVKTQQNIGDP